MDTDPLNDTAIRGLEEALDDVKHRRMYSEEEIITEFGVDIR